MSDDAIADRNSDGAVPRKETHTRHIPMILGLSMLIGALLALVVLAIVYGCLVNRNLNAGNPNAGLSNTVSLGDFDKNGKTLEYDKAHQSGSFKVIDGPTYLPDGIRISLSDEFARAHLQDPKSADTIIINYHKEATAANQGVDGSGAKPLPSPPGDDDLKALIDAIIAAGEGKVAGTPLDPTQYSAIYSKSSQYLAWITAYLADNKNASNDWQILKTFLQKFMNGDWPQTNPLQSINFLEDLVGWMKWTVSTKAGLTHLIDTYHSAIKQSVMNGILAAKGLGTGDESAYLSFDVNKTAMDKALAQKSTIKTCDQVSSGDQFCRTGHCTVCPASWWQSCPAGNWKMMESKGCDVFGCEGYCVQATPDQRRAVSGICDAFIGLDKAYWEATDLLAILNDPNSQIGQWLKGSQVLFHIAEALGALLTQAGIFPQVAIVETAMKAIIHDVLPYVPGIEFVVADVADICSFFQCENASYGPKDGWSCVCKEGHTDSCNATGSSTQAYTCLPAGADSAAVVARTCTSNNADCLHSPAGKCTSVGSQSLQTAAALEPMPARMMPGAMLM